MKVELNLSSVFRFSACFVGRILPLLSLTLLVNSAAAQADNGAEQGASNKAGGQGGAASLCYELIQKSAVVGEQNLIIGEDGLCAASSDGILKIIARAPDWRVSICNLKTGKVYSTDVAHFFSYIPSSAGKTDKTPAVNFLLKPLSARGAGFYMGQSVAKYISPSAFVQHIAHKKQMGEVETEEPQEINYAVFNRLKIQAPVAKILSRLYRVPVKQGLPASLSFHNAAGRQVNYLETLRIKAGTMNGAPYEMPSRLEVVGSAKEAVGE